jgi:hypothetical protein
MGISRREYLTKWYVTEFGMPPYLMNEAIYSVALSHPEGWLDTIVDSETGKEITKEE